MPAPKMGVSRELDGSREIPGRSFGYYVESSTATLGYITIADVAGAGASIANRIRPS
jgi:hypothetical protein